MSFRLYNTLTRRKDPFVPVHEGRVGIYMCGMTVQDRPHMGHMRAFMAGDVLRRYLIYRGYQVTYVQNFTDIDDKIILKARAEGEDWRKIAERNIEAYFQVSDQLNILRADYYPRATLYVQEILELIGRLMAQGVAYQGSDGSIYFDVSKFPGYGKLSGKRLEELMAGARVEPGAGKRNPLDFALWKAWKEGEPYWYSPWVRGRPGWHIECSAMSTHHLGQPFDIHGGGADLIFPHHENEIAQSEAAHGKDFARYWFHVGFVTLSGEKMSKSTGLYFAASEALKRFSPNAIRLYFLRTHYRSPIEFSEERLLEAEASWERFQVFFARLGEVPEGEDWLDGEAVARFEAAMDDDLNTPKALAVLFDLLHKGNEALEAGREEEARGIGLTLATLLQVLGFEPETGRELGDVAADLVSLIVEVRSLLRREKRFDLADRIRDRLRRLGIVLEDTPKGTLWRFSR